MKKFLLLACALLLGALLSTGCAIRPDRAAPLNTLFDLGLPPANAAGLPAVRVSIADIGAPVWLDTPAMFYRLAYANAQQPRAYAHHRWIMPPLQLFAQRLKARIAQAGGIAALATDAPTNLSTVRIDADDFTQVFDAPDKSVGRAAMRVSVFTGRTLIAQRSFGANVVAPTSDAAGGAKALAAAGDAVIDDIVRWLASLPLKHP